MHHHRRIRPLRERAQMQRKLTTWRGLAAQLPPLQIHHNQVTRLEEALVNARRSHQQPRRVEPSRHVSIIRREVAALVQQPAVQNDLFPKRLLHLGHPLGTGDAMSSPSCVYG